MEKTIVSLLFIGSAPKFLFLGDKMDSPMYRVEGFVAIYLALAFSFIPAIALSLILDSIDTFYKACFILLIIMLLILLWKVLAIKDSTIQAYFYNFNKMSKAKALCLFVAIFISQFFFLLFPCFLAKSILI